MLHARHEPASFDLGAHRRAVCGIGGQTLEIDDRGQRLVVEVEPLELAPEAAQAIALVANELGINAFRYAFAPGEAGMVRVRGADGVARAQPRIADDGGGLPCGFACGSAEGFAQQLVETTAEQVGVTIDVSARGETCITLARPRTPA